MIGAGIIAAVVLLLYFSLAGSAGMADRKRYTCFLPQEGRVAWMGIDVRVQNAPKLDEIIAAQVKLEEDLRNCMSCRFFYGNNSQCLAKKCIKEESRPEIMKKEKESPCFGCPYRKSEKYCFPCMRKILRR